MKLVMLWVLIGILSVSCTTSIRFSSENNMTESGTGNSIKKSVVNAKVGYTFKGEASYYADKYDGRKTASGEIFKQNKLTAAHRTLAFGTKCKVTNLQNRKSVIVIINDRGPFIKGRVIDLSKSAAIKLDMIKQGIAEVEVEIIE